VRPHPYEYLFCNFLVGGLIGASRRYVMDYWVPDWDHADFYIAPTHMNCDRLLRGKIVNVIERVGVPIGVVKDLRGISPRARWAPVEIAHDHSANPDAGGKPHGCTWATKYSVRAVTGSWDLPATVVADHVQPQTHW
jgi:hypothetical protein